MKAVADSSVLIALRTIGQLTLLPARFPEGILIPQAVWRKVVETGEQQSGAAEVATAAWIQVHSVKDRDFVTLVRAELDEGEAEAIALAREEQTILVLLDEKDARRVAQRLNLKVLGTVGLLVWAKRMGMVVNLREQLDGLRTLGKFRLSQAVYEQALRAVGEMDR